MKKISLVLLVALSGCATVHPQDVRNLDARITKMEIRYKGIEDSLEEIRVYLNKKSEYDQKNIDKRKKFEQSIQDQLKFHSDRINNLMPNYQNKY